MGNGEKNVAALSIYVKNSQLCTLNTVADMSTVHFSNFTLKNVLNFLADWQKNLRVCNSTYIIYFKHVMYVCFC